MFIHPAYFTIVFGLAALVSLAWIWGSARRRARLSEGGSLADRVAVLEKLATDPAARLEREIDSL